MDGVLLSSWRGGWSGWGGGGGCGEGCYKKVGGNGWRVRVWLWGKGRRGDILRPLCACVGESHHPATSPALGHWPLCRIHIKNSGPVKMTPETNPVTSSALKWPLVDMARTVCHFGLRCGVLCACGQYLYARWGAGCVCQGRGVLRAASETQQDYCGWSLMLESHCCLHDTTGVPIGPRSYLLLIVLWLLYVTFRYDDVIFEKNQKIFYKLEEKTLLMESFVAHKTFLELHNKTCAAAFSQTTQAAGDFFQNIKKMKLKDAKMAHLVWSKS